MYDKVLYKSKVVKGETAVKKIESGQRVVIGHGAAEPSYLVQKLVDNRNYFANVEIIQMLPGKEMPLIDPGMEKSFHYNSLFVGQATKQAVMSGNADYTPCYFYKVPELFHSVLPVDVALIHVSPPDSNGFCSFGVGVDYIKTAAENAALVIAQVNRNMPYVNGNSKIHIRDIDYIVEYDVQLSTVGYADLSAAEKKIGNYCAELISDGDTLQVGIGTIPNAVLEALEGKRNLGIHSELISDGIMKLMKKGIVTNGEKEINKGKTIASFAYGSQELYKYINNNPCIEMHPVDYVNHPINIMKHDNFVSINSCVQMDLMGQVASETVNNVQISGIGGLADFVRGSEMAKNGRSIIAMTSTAKNGTVSKIVPKLNAGTAISLSRNEVDYVVTEYGIAHLRGASLKERRKRLIEIAHPKFREEIKEPSETVTIY